MKTTQYQQKIKTYYNSLTNKSEPKELLSSYQSFCQDMTIYFDLVFWQEKRQTEENDLFCNFVKFKWENDLKKIETLYQYFKKHIYKGMRKEKRNSYKLNELIDEQFFYEYKKLQQENPFKAYYNQISHYENNTNPINSKDENKKDTDNSFTTQLLDEYKAFCKANDLPFDSLFFEKKINSGKEQKTIYDYLLQRWKKQLEETEYEWLETRIEPVAKSLKELSQYLQFGISLDIGNSIGNLASQDIEFLKILNTQLKKMKKLKEILDLLGRAFGKNNATKNQKRNGKY
ncbi:hypothetical protein ACIWO4_10060 [Avibacterium paragallinarum]|uniref:hypothetical protein n=1 Tax=Avibacterium paragallinarum TaxID=728 RepID=UPI003987F4AA